MKQSSRRNRPRWPAVAPRAGAWIETVNLSIEPDGVAVAPCAGAWIETLPLEQAERSERVAPCAGAWIETTRIRFTVQDHIEPLPLPKAELPKPRRELGGVNTAVRLSCAAAPDQLPCCWSERRIEYRHDKRIVPATSSDRRTMMPRAKRTIAELRRLLAEQEGRLQALEKKRVELERALRRVLSEIGELAGQKPAALGLTAANTDFQQFRK